MRDAPTPQRTDRAMARTTEGVAVYYYRIAVFVLLSSMTVFGGDWPQFRGPNRDNISSETGLYRT
jgi:hypothetical protein